MKKIINYRTTHLLFLIFAFTQSFGQEKNHPQKNLLSGDYRLSKEDAYPRVYFEFNSKSPWGFTTGLNADARGLFHAELTHTLINGVKITAGPGYHHKQGGLHFVTGVIFHKEFTNHWELEGYSRIIFNHTDYFGSEIEYQRIWNDFSAGISSEVEIGKKFTLLEDGKMSKDDFEKESVFLIGPIGSIKIIDDLSIRGMFLAGGAQIEHEDLEFFWKVSCGLKWNF